MAIGRKTGGRQKGVRNKSTLRRKAELAASGLSPLEYMLGIMRDRDVPRHDRLDAAKNAAPYVHPKLATVDIGNKDGDAFKVAAGELSPNEIGRRIAFALAGAMPKTEGSD